MSEAHKKPGIVFWITVILIAVLVGYPLSIGPACWISSWTGGAGATILPRAYRPIIATGHSYPATFQAIQWYSRLGASDGWRWIETEIIVLGQNDTLWEYDWRYLPAFSDY